MAQTHARTNFGSELMATGEYPEEIRKLPMFHANLRSREEALAYVQRHNQGEGTFVIRPNSINDSSFVSISTSVSDGDVCHAKVFIQPKNGRYLYWIAEKLKFRSFQALLKYYSEHRITCTQNNNIRLLIPLIVTKGFSYQPTSLNSQQQLQQAGKIDQGQPTERLPLSSNQDEVQASAHYNDGVLKAQARLGASVTGNQITTVSELQPTSSHKQSPELRTTALHSTIPAEIVSVNCATNSQDIRNVGHIRRDTLERSPAHSWFVESPMSQSSESGRKPRSQSESQVHENKAKTVKGTVPQRLISTSSMENSTLEFRKTRPPLPLPPTEDTEVYYTEVKIRNYFEELYQELKQTEKCECGLRHIDSQLPLDWTIHRSRDQATFNRIFYQKGDKTTWSMPEEVVPYLTTSQVHFMLYLYGKSKLPLPTCLKKLLDGQSRVEHGNENELKTKMTGSTTAGSPATSSTTSSSSSSSSMNSDSSRISASPKQVSFSQVETKPSSSPPTLWSQPHTPINMNVDNYPDSTYEVSSNVFVGQHNVKSENSSVGGLFIMSVPPEFPSHNTRETRSNSSPQILYKLSVDTPDAEA